MDVDTNGVFHEHSFVDSPIAMQWIAALASLEEGTARSTIHR